MTCLLCGEACTCALIDCPMDGESAALTSASAQAALEGRMAPECTVKSTQSVADSPRPKFVVTQEADIVQSGWHEGGREVASRTPAVQQNSGIDPSPVGATEPAVASNSPADLLQPPDADSWRDEVSARLNRYRARRRPRAPRYPSLRLRFETPPASTPSIAPVDEIQPAIPPATSAPFTIQALAMNPVEEEPAPLPDIAEKTAQAPAEPPRAAQVFAKILEFPRWAYGPPATLHELADPVVDRPRILEVPEVVTPPPAMGGITIEDARSIEAERQPGIDMPLRPAPLGLRVWAALVDGLIVLLACAMFGYLFYRLTGARPPMWEMIGLSAGLPCVFWAAYQYLFVVYCGTTLGLRSAHLRISRFDGSPVRQRTRRMRVLCSILSGVSLGMGYAWQFLDEDALCWHERVTRTYLSPPA